MKHLKNLFVLIITTLSFNACVGVPAAPEIKMYLHDQPKAQALCTDTKDGSKCPAVGIDQTNNWFMFPPSEWESIQNYIDELIRRLETKSFVSTTASPRPYYKLTLDDLYFIRQHLNDIRSAAQNGLNASDKTN